MKTPYNEQKDTHIPILLINDREVLDFRHYESTTESAIIPLYVIEKLAELLPSAPTKDIISNFIYKLSSYNDNNINHEDYLKLLQEEIEFHNTINLLNTYKEEKRKY